MTLPSPGSPQAQKPGSESLAVLQFDHWYDIDNFPPRPGDYVLDVPGSSVDAWQVVRFSRSGDGGTLVLKLAEPRYEPWRNDPDAIVFSYRWRTSRRASA